MKHDMKRYVLVFVGMLCLTPLSSASGQSIASYPAAERGDRSIMLGVDGGGLIGYWMRRSERTDWGLDVAVNGIVGSGSGLLTITATPALKHYRAAAGALAPYSYFGIPLSVAFSGNSNVFRIGGVAAFGLEWLPLPEVSIGGHVGVRASYHHADGRSGLLEFATLSSGLRLHFYF